MKHLKIFAVMIAVCIISAFAFQSSENKETLFEENVEALTATGFDPAKACDLWCRIAVDQVCVLMTNYGFPINCHDMRMP